MKISLVQFRMNLFFSLAHSGTLYTVSEQAYLHILNVLMKQV